MAEENKAVEAAKQRVSTIRVRTWTLTLAIIVSLVFYFLVTVTTKQQINWIEFLLMCVIQIVVHSLYFPDGELFGQKNESFQANKKAYNERASKINEQRQISQLRKYCKIEFEKRKETYFLAQLGKLKITEDEFEKIKWKSEKEIKELSQIEIFDTIDGEERSRLIFFSKQQRKILYDLIFKPFPVEENHPETIMSAIENNYNKAIKDGSISYKAQSYIRKILMAVVVGGVFAYIGYTLRDGFGITEIVSICMYLTTLFTTAVMAFTSGETCSKVHKSHFYLNLADFIDEFNEWNDNDKKIKNKEN